MGKSDVVRQAAADANLPCKSLLGTQIAPEDVSGVPRIVGERSVFCPPRVLLPEQAEPFCLFLDELPACTPDVPEWLTWARGNGVRADMIDFIDANPDALLRPVPREAVPFSTPRAWASLS